VVKGGPHNVAWTHAEEVNDALVNFVSKGAAKSAASTKHEAVA
jgi:hypothetical protein